MPRYTITCAYDATGEGLTQMILYTYAQDKADALKKFAERFDPYFLPGCTVVEGYDLECRMAQNLLSVAMMKMLRITDCMVTFHAHAHLNCS